MSKTIRRLTPQQKKEIIHKYNNGFRNCAQLGIEYGVSGVAIGNMLRKNNIEVYHGVISEKEKLQIINLRNSDKLSTNGIAKFLGISSGIVCRVIKKYQLEKRVFKKNKFNENYFNSISSEHQAYFLGLMYADGYNDNVRNVANIQLQEKDKEILDSFSRVLCCNYKLQFIDKSKHPTHQSCYRLNLVSQKMSSDLARLGCIAKKSLILKFPAENQVPKYLWRHFIRGYFDGDGGIGFWLCGNYHKMNCAITSSKDFCLSLKYYIENAVKVSCYIANIKNHDNTKRICISGNCQILKFLDWLYKDANVFMERKYQKYIELKQLHKKTRKYKYEK